MFLAWSLQNFFIILILPKCTTGMPMLSLPSEDASYLLRTQMKSAVENILARYFSRKLYFLALHKEDVSHDPAIDEMMTHIYSVTSVPVLSLANFDGDVTKYSRSYTFSRLDTTESAVGYVLLAKRLGGDCLPGYNSTSLPFWNPQARFLLVLTEVLAQDPPHVLGALKDCWNSFNMLNVAAVYSSGAADPPERRLSVTSYNPFNDTFSRFEVGPEGRRGSLDVYPQKLLDTNGFVFDVSTSPVHELVDVSYDEDGEVSYSGPAFSVTCAAVKKLNGTANPIPPVSSIFVTDLEHSRTLYADEASYMWGMLRWYTYPHEWMCLTGIVPKAKQIPRYMNIVMPLSYGLWGLYSVTFLVVGSCWRLSAGPSALLESVRLAASGACLKMPRAAPQRTLVLAATLCYLVVMNSYQGALTGYLFSTHYHPDISDVDELLDSGLKQCMFMSLSDLTEMAGDFDVSGKAMQVFLSDPVLITDEREALDVVATHGNISRWMSRVMALHATTLPRYREDDGEPKLHVVDGCFFVYPMSHWVMTPNSPFLARFNAVAMRMLEAGFVPKWRRDYTAAGERASLLGRRGGAARVITFTHLLIPFCGLASGLCLGSLALLLEVLTSAARAHSTLQTARH
ncbi:uncharacterized protein LOC134537387 [Bacillus rossius redtenbacheri]|uniref:uncharacterized protein LOC134537387 n=1 Tax=Bacillus rossius redtenbacheri TaxID=93214 RepID=UPI002FDDC1FC